MRNRRKFLTIATVVLLAAGLAAGFALAQESEETETATTSAPESMLSRVASILGIEEGTLVAAFEQAKLDALDEAVADGQITAEQAEAMKVAMEARSAVQAVLEEAIESGQLTQEQAQLLGGRLQQGRSMAQLGQGPRGRMQERFDGAQGAGGFGFMLRTPRGGMMRGGVWGRCP